MFIHAVINGNLDYFTFNGMFVLYLQTFCPGNVMVEIKTDVVFLVFIKNSKRHTRDMINRKRTIIMSNKDDYDS